MQTKQALKEAIKAAEAGINAVDANPNQYQFKEVATAKRRSMDLSNSLVEVRKSTKWG